MMGFVGECCYLNMGAAANKLLLEAVDGMRFSYSFFKMGGKENSTSLGLLIIGKSHTKVEFSMLTCTWCRK